MGIGERIRSEAVFAAGIVRTLAHILPLARDRKRTLPPLVDAPPKSTLMLKGVGDRQRVDGSSCAVERNGRREDPSVARAVEVALVENL